MHRLGRIWLRRKRSRFTVLVQADEPGTVVIFEPLGTEYVLGVDDRVTVEIRDPAYSGGGANLEIVHQPGAIMLWLATTDYAAWNKAGDELAV